ncbi:hypothetical protein [Rhodococcus koreensis]|uniref:hypothetical protein n=1 Tax=Rhodococcus koreensis TaxID=99653 RepID=UPI0036D7A9EE
MDDFDHASLGAIMAELARSWTAPTDVDHTLHAVTQAAVDLIPGADSADILLSWLISLVREFRT